MKLIYKNEKPLFAISVIISAIFWIALLSVTFGTLLIYILIGYLAFLFAHSLFISYLKGTGVKISENQYPDLYERVKINCSKVGVAEIPETYLLRTGFFNALATKFLGRYFIVIFTDILDALEDHPAAVDFYIGHELGHIHRKHLSWSVFIAPSSILPLLGSALRRAEEYTCDRYAVACCDSAEDIKAALAAIAAGDSRWKTINIESYINQVAETKGFWMSFNELTSDYPWLTKRTAVCLSLSNGEKAKLPHRNLFAWLLAAFVPRIGGGSAVSSLMIITLFGILAAIALPAYQANQGRSNDAAHISAAYSDAKIIEVKVEEYVMNNNAWPSSLVDLGYQEESIKDATNNYEISIYKNGIIGANVGEDKSGESKYLVLEPSVENGVISWVCYGENIKEQVLPSDCI